MPQEFDYSANVHLNRDDQGLVRDLLHIEAPYISNARTPVLAAEEYLAKYGEMLGIEPGQIRNLGLSPDERPREAGIEYRLLDEKTQFDSTTVVFSQTLAGLPVWDAAVAVHVQPNPYRIVGAQSTTHPDLHLDLPAAPALERLHKISEEALARSLGLPERGKEFDRASLKIERQKWYIYRYESAKRLRVAVDPGTETPREPHAEHLREPEREAPHRHHHPVPNLPPVPDEIKESRHYVVSAVYFVLGTRQIPELHWVALIEAETLAVLMLRAFVDTVNGFVFVEDPITTNGGPGPNATDAALNPLRRSVLLPGLSPPLGGNYALRGDLVQLQDVEAPVQPAPLEPVGTDFNFNVRTDNFSATNAYYHCDRFFRIVQGLGFDLPVFFGGTLFPSVVDHRGMGITINAHCLGNGAFGILQTTFALANLANIVQPIGIACDFRVVLHELGGHGILYNHVNSANFHFSHSAGDSFAAILNDPDSVAPDRFLTFPWVGSVIDRRHDRTPATGWGWNGNIGLNPFNFFLDPGGYNNEQILSTTHFRVYRSIGGDSTELAMRRFAADYVAYLMLRGVAALTPPTSPPTALGWSSDLMIADLGNWTSASQIGGCYWKVIRWAFEKQGLFQPAAMPKPNNNEGAPPPVDVYIDDGRHGEYQYGPVSPYLQRFWETTDIWNRRHPDGAAEHQTPLVDRTNYAYVIVKNRGTQVANNVTVRGWHSRPAAGLIWPDDWKPMTTDSLVVPAIPSGGQVVVGPFEWRPGHRGHECMFMGASAPGDPANNDPAIGLPSAVGPTPLWRLVPCDNNLGLRAVIPVPGGGHRHELVEAFEHRSFWAGNPLERTAKMEIRPVLPPFLTTRGWGVKLDNPGGGSFTLGSHDSREIRPRLISGQDFTAAEVQAAGHVAIEFIVLADGLVVGGLTYVLDPKLKEVPREEPEEEHHEKDEKCDKHEAHDECCKHEKHEKCKPHIEVEDCCDKSRPRRLRVEVDLD